GALMSATAQTVSLRPGGRLRRRRIVNRIMECIGTGAALAAVGLLGLVVVSVTLRAWPALSWHFLTTPPALFGPPGGISSAIIGSALIVGMATGMALPVGVLGAIYLTEFATRRVAVVVQLCLDVLNGMPTIVTGIFVYGLLVIGHVQSAFAGAIPVHVARVEIAQQRKPPLPELREVVFDVQGWAVSYGASTAISNVDLDVYRNSITAVIGPSGCGKSTFIRCLNRMNDLVAGAKIDGKVLYHGEDLYGDGVDPVEVRRRIGMVFQKPNPFPKSIYDNVAWGPRVLGMKKGLDERVEKALRGAALWDEVKDRLKKSALSLSGGQQQRLCIAQAIAIEPEVLLLDEPASALDPIATSAIEELMHELKRDYTLVIVTHNMQQAARVADLTAFFSLEVGDGRRTGVLVE